MSKQIKLPIEKHTTLWLQSEEQIHKFDVSLEIEAILKIKAFVKYAEKCYLSDITSFPNWISAWTNLLGVTRLCVCVL